MAVGRKTGGRDFTTGHGRPKGSKNKHPSSAKEAVRFLLDRYGADTTLLSQVLERGLRAAPPSSFPYLRLIVEQLAGAPEQGFTVHTRIVHEHHGPRLLQDPEVERDA